jgi:hypothetical protein
MRLWILLFLCSLCFAQYTDPPIEQVMDYNENFSSSLDNLYNNSIAFNGTIDLFFGGYTQTQTINTSVDVAGLTLLIDNTTSPVDDLSLLIARGYSMGHLTSLPSEGYPQFTCDEAWYNSNPQYLWRCDFDQDGCAEFEMATNATYDLNATFTFRGVNSTVLANGTLVPLPQNVLDEMKTSSGAENLTINITGNVTFFYQLNNRTTVFDCADNITTINASVPISINRSYNVAGENKLFFLRSPVLREQWFMNNDFNIVVLSQSPLYYVELDMNGNRMRNLTTRNFSITQNSYGVREINSSLTNETNYAEFDSNVTNPVPLEQANNSFLYVYEFNYSYSGIGQNNFSLRVRDNFLNESEFNDSITSRMLSYDGKFLEDGSPVSNFSRPSAGFEKDTLTQITVGFGLIALILFLAFFNFWLS